MGKHKPLSEMAAEYLENANILKARINELRLKQKIPGMSFQQRRNLNAHILALELIYADNRSTAAYLARYHNKNNNTRSE